MKKKWFYLGLGGLVAFEIAKVYFIMPMPGSQRMNSVDFAYFLHTWRWAFRGLFVVLAVAGARDALAVRRKWLPLLAVVPAAAIAWGFNFKMTADHMFQEPVNPVYLGQDKNAVDAEAVWSTTDFRCGDAALFRPHTLHCSLPNRSGDRLRLSADFRYGFWDEASEVDWRASAGT